MALDFPSPVTNGTTYAPGAPALGSWVYDGVKWNAAGGANALTTISDTAPVGYPAGSLWWNSSAGDGQLYLYYNDGTSSQWVVANNPGSGIYLPLVGGQLNPGGLLIGAAGTVPAAGSLTLNANTGTPPSFAPALGGAPNLYTVGANGNPAWLALDGFGSGGPPLFVGRAARGTAAAPTAVQQNDLLAALVGIGYGASAYGGGFGGHITIAAAENWTATAQGTRINLYTSPTGGTSEVASLILAGNSATFSGTVTLPTNNALFFNGATGGNAGRMYSDGTSLALSVAAGGGQFAIQNSGGTTQATFDSAGNLTTLGNVTGKSVTTRPGAAGSAEGHGFNISWGASGPAHLWIDTSDLGSINLTPCDERLKTNLKAPTVDALGAINAIALRQFDWLANDLVPEHHEDIGFTAQQLADVIPDAVTVPDDPDQMASVQLTPIVAHLIGAVQQLTERLKAGGL